MFQIKVKLNVLKTKPYEYGIRDFIFVEFISTKIVASIGHESRWIDNKKSRSKSLYIPFLLFTEKKSARRRSRKNPKRKKNAKSNPWQISTLVCHKSAFPRIRHLLQFLQQFATLVLKTNANKIQFCRWALINLSVMI